MKNEKLELLVSQWRENGSIWLGSKIFMALCHRVRDISVSSRIGCSSVQLGKSPRISGFRHITIGTGFRAGDHLWLEAVIKFGETIYNPQIIIGDRVGLSDFVHIASTTRVVLGNDVLIGSRVLITDHNHGSYNGAQQTSPSIPPTKRRLSSDATVIIGSNVWVGDGVVILPGANIGDGAIIGANAVVAADIPANCIAAGVPAKPIRSFDPKTSQWSLLNKL